MACNSNKQECIIYDLVPAPFIKPSASSPSLAFFMILSQLFCSREVSWLRSQRMQALGFELSMALCVCVCVCVQSGPRESPLPLYSILSEQLFSKSILITLSLPMSSATLYSHSFISAPVKQFLLKVATRYEIYLPWLLLLLKVFNTTTFSQTFRLEFT
jgi:hypothetical protein